MSEPTGQSRDSNGKPVSFWHTAPGIISAFAALITAVAGLVGVLYTTGAIGGSAGAATPTGIIRTATESSNIAGATATPDDGPGAPTATAPPSFAEAATGSFTLESWIEASGLVTLYIDVLDGTLDVQPSGAADWLLSVQERGESASPQPQIFCGGQITFAEQRLDGVPGGDRNGTIDFTSDLDSNRADLFLALCGWNVAGEAAPFNLILDTDGAGRTVLVMRNKDGAFRWVKS